MPATAMITVIDNARENALRARAEAAEAEAAAARRAVEYLAGEVRKARAWAHVRHERLREIERAAVAHIPHVRDDRARLSLYDIAVRAHRA
jgi:hypothetical protein